MFVPIVSSFVFYMSDTCKTHAGAHGSQSVGTFSDRFLHATTVHHEIPSVAALRLHVATAMMFVCVMT